MVNSVKILVVDDSKSMLNMLQDALQCDGHTVLQAENGLEALKIIEQEDIRLVITDLSMPVMDGLDLLRRIRAYHSSCYIYVIMLTANREKSVLVEGMDAGADDFMVKPFDSVELRLRVRAGERILSLETHQLTIFALAQLADIRDHNTGLHLKRIREYSRVMAQHIFDLPEMQGKLCEDYVDLIYLTSPLHDIGKVGIPDYILLKPARLDDDEFAIMKTHAELGGKTLSAAFERAPETRYLKMARDIALYHHERYDGKGYPTGKAGRKIPLCARIVSVGDVYDALVTERVYKEPLTHKEARSIILEGRGTQFDPMVVDAFIASEILIKSFATLLSEDSSEMLERKAS